MSPHNSLDETTSNASNSTHTHTHKHSNMEEAETEKERREKNTVWHPNKEQQQKY
jgi:hypothetical protein